MKKLIAFALVVALTFSAVGCASTPAVPPPAAADAATPPPPAQPAEYLLGVGDSLDITVYRNDDLKTSTKINPSGRIMFPLIGEVQAAGRTVTTLREDLRERFSKYLVDPQVSISVSTIQSQRVLVLGEVRTPGLYSYDADLSVLDAVAKAGGWTTDARLDAVLLLRNVGGKVETRPIDVESGIAGGKLPENLVLQRNDIVYVPTKKIADLSRFMSYIGNILSPIVMAEGGIVLFPQMIDALAGKRSGTLAIPTH